VRPWKVPPLDPLFDANNATIRQNLFRIEPIVMTETGPRTIIIFSSTRYARFQWNKKKIFLLGKQDGLRSTDLCHRQNGEVL